jgi:GNAT superfamily N-acetyltransferase
MDVTASADTPAAPTPAVTVPVEAGTPWRVRPAVADDAERISVLVRELARYERELDSVRATAEDFRTALFAPNPRVHCHVAEISGPEGPLVVGMALWFVNFSTWEGRHGLWLEDLFVEPEYRRLGLGRALLETLAKVCVERGYRRLEWWVLNWNTPAHDFYRSLGAVAQPDWTTWRIDDEALARLGGSTS